MCTISAFVLSLKDHLRWLTWHGVEDDSLGDARSCLGHALFEEASRIDIPLHNTHTHVYTYGAYVCICRVYTCTAVFR